MQNWGRGAGKRENVLPTIHRRPSRQTDPLRASRASLLRSFLSSSLLLHLPRPVSLWLFNPSVRVCLACPLFVEYWRSLRAKLASGRPTSVAGCSQPMSLHPVYPRDRTVPRMLAPPLRIRHSGKRHHLYLCTWTLEAKCQLSGSSSLSFFSIEKGVPRRQLQLVARAPAECCKARPVSCSISFPMILTAVVVPTQDASENMAPSEHPTYSRPFAPPMAIERPLH